jgi:N6-L-threonylcarbamoyladenine synthase
LSSDFILGLETSCDETSAAVLSGDDRILGHVILSQDVHEVYGGVVPELAARVHLRRVDRVVGAALKEAGIEAADLGAIAVTAGPGLVGALLVGVSWARAAGWALGCPVVPVHHMEAHLFGPSLEDAEAEPPFIALLVSGGHTLLLHASEWGSYTLLGQTRDDAAGEAFDKVAKMLDLPYPGGPAVEALATRGSGDRFDLPRPMLRSDQGPEHPGYYDFSFSGLKTAVATLVSSIDAMGVLEERRADVAASFQEAAVDALVRKVLRAVDQTGCRRVLLGGGVSANLRLRTAMAERLGDGGRVFRASPRLSLDNGAMVARAGRFRLERGDLDFPGGGAAPKLDFPGMRTREAISRTDPSPAASATRD